MSDFPLCPIGEIPFPRVILPSGSRSTPFGRWAVFLSAKPFEVVGQFESGGFKQRLAFLIQNAELFRARLNFSFRQVASQIRPIVRIDLSFSLVITVLLSMRSCFFVFHFLFLRICYFRLSAKPGVARGKAKCGLFFVALPEVHGDEKVLRK